MKHFDMRNRKTGSELRGTKWDDGAVSLYIAGPGGQSQSIGIYPEELKKLIDFLEVEPVASKTASEK